MIHITRKILPILLCFFSTLSFAQYADNQIDFVGNVSAYDQDSGQTLRFSITAGNQEKFFAIDPYSGALTVKHSAYATFSGQRTWKLIVTVTDNDQKNPLSSSAIITVILKKDALNGKVQPTIAKQLALQSE